MLPQTHTRLSCALKNSTPARWDQRTIHTEHWRWRNVVITLLLIILLLVLSAGKKVFAFARLASAWQVKIKLKSNLVSIFQHSVVCSLLHLHTKHIYWMCALRLLKSLNVFTQCFTPTKLLSVHERKCWCFLGHTLLLTARSDLCDHPVMFFHSSVRHGWTSRHQSLSAATRRD